MQQKAIEESRATLIQSLPAWQFKNHLNSWLLYKDTLETPTQCANNGCKFTGQELSGQELYVEP